MMTALLTGIGAARGDTMELGFNTTAGAVKFLAPVAHFQNLVQASLVAGIFGLKLFDGVFHG